MRRSSSDAGHTSGVCWDSEGWQEVVEWKVARAGWAVWWRQAIERQAAAGISEAAALILVVDGQTGVTGADEEVVAWLRRTHPSKPVGCRGSPGPAMQLLCWWRHVGHVPAVTAAPTRTGRRGLRQGQRMRPWQRRRAEVVMGTQVVLAVNKCENVGKADEQAADFWALGLSPIAISAISGTGTGDLMDALVRSLPPPPPMQVCLPPPLRGPPLPAAPRMLAWQAASSGPRLLSHPMARPTAPHLLGAVWRGGADSWQGSAALQAEDVDRSSIAVAIVGRPNVGKSSLVNAITGALLLLGAMLCALPNIDSLDADHQGAEGAEVGVG